MDVIQNWVVVINANVSMQTFYVLNFASAMVTVKENRMGQPVNAPKTQGNVTI